MLDPGAQRFLRHGVVDLDRAHDVVAMQGDQRSQPGPVYAAKARGAVNLAADGIVKVEADQAVAIGAQPIGVRRDPKVLLNLSVARVVPVAGRAIGIPRENFAQRRPSWAPLPQADFPGQGARPAPKRKKPARPGCAGERPSAPVADVLARH